MQQGLDLSKFRKISVDKKSTTLRHSRGHEIKVAHSGMSPKMKEQIEALPVYMAEGGEVDTPDEDVTDTGGETPVGEVATPVKEATAPPVEPDASAPPTEAPATSDTYAPPAPNREPDASPPPAPAPRRSPTAQELNAEDQEFARDMEKGHITPETTSSLFAKKDTLGKIGTLFGLLVSGFGSGLAGQPNAVMQMMQNEINNDLEAQKQTNNNARNWYHLSLQHEMQKANIERTGVENEYTRAHTGKIPSEVERTKAETYGKKIQNEKDKMILKELGGNVPEMEAANASMYAGTAAQNKMSLTAVQQMYDIASRMSEGPDKQKALAMLKDQITPAVVAQIGQTNQKSALVGGMRNQMAQQQKGADDAPATVDSRRILDVARRNDFIKSNGGIPRGFTSDQASKAMDEGAVVDKNRRAYKIWHDSYEHLDKKFLGGQLNPENYSSIKAGMVTQLMQSGVTKDEAHDLASAMTPGYKDFGETRETKAAQGYEHFLTAESGTKYLDSVPGLKPKFPAPPQVQKKKGSGSTGSFGETKDVGEQKPKDIPIGTVQNFNGADYKKVKGGWDKVK